MSDLTSTKVLIIQSSEIESLKIGKLLDFDNSIDYEVFHVINLAEAYNFLEAVTIDIILVDLFLEDSYGIHTFDDLYAKHPSIPFIVLTDIDDDMIGKSAVNKGAQDYLIKSELTKNIINKTISHSIERKKFEYRLRKSEEKYRELFMRSKDAIYISTVEGEFIDINPAGLKMFGYSREDIETLQVSDLYVDKHARKLLIEELSSKGVVKDYELELIKKDGETVLNCILTTLVVRDEQNNTVGYQGIIKDITAKKNAEKALFRSMRELDQANKELNYLNYSLEEKVQERTAELKFEKEKVENQNKEITESIQYAKRIQASILPPDRKIKAGFESNFIYYAPKDIVSGDFYWFEKKNNTSYLAIVDCTGHGVPGAFMSIIGYTQLNDIINQNATMEVGDILKELDIRVQSALNQEDQSNSKDGMELGILSYNSDENLLSFSGAMRPLYFVREGELEILKANKFSVGGVSKREKVFNTCKVKLKKGDMAYLFSDGYPDQFGGPNSKKFMTKNVGKMVKHISKLPIEDQKEIVIKSITEWMGNEEQIDDILIAGIQF